MGHACLKASDERCRVLASCAPRGATQDVVIDTISSASARLTQVSTSPQTAVRPVTRKLRKVD